MLAWMLRLFREPERGDWWHVITRDGERIPVVFVERRTA